MRKVTRAIASLESIDFQRKKSFFNELTVAVSQSRKGERGADFDPHGQIATVIKKHTNVNVAEITVYEQSRITIQAAFIPLSKHSTVITKATRNAIDQSGPRFKDNLAGTVDLKNSKVYGVFAVLPCRIYLSSELAYGTAVDDDELASLFLHEIGHVFTSFEYMAQTTMRSVTLANTTEEFFSTKEKHKRIAVLANIQSQEGIDLNDVDVLLELETSKEGKQLFQCVIETARLSRDRSETGNGLYNERSGEQLADQFAARHGAARQLTTALDKAFRSNKSRSLRSGVKNLYIEASKALLIMLTPVSAVIYWPSSLFVIGALISVSDHQPTSTSYDTDRERLIKLRNQLVEQSKDRDLPKELTAQVLDDIKYVDTIIEKYQENKGLFEALHRVVSRSRRKALKAIDVQTELENLSNNELYLSALQLKNIAYKG